MRTMSLHTYPFGFEDGVVMLRTTGRPITRVTRRWCGLDGSTYIISELGFLDDEAEIKARVLERAKKDGWTPKRWWKFWRWDDTPNPRAMEGQN